MSTDKTTKKTNKGIITLPKKISNQNISSKNQPHLFYKNRSVEKI